MAFVVSESLLAQLRQACATHAAAASETLGAEAFVLDPGLGPACYLTADGRVLIEEGDGSREEPSEIRAATEAEAVRGIVVGASKTGVIALLDVLPRRPADGVACASCRGTRWVTHGTAVDGTSLRLLCGACDGLGWTTR